MGPRDCINVVFFTPPFALIYVDTSYYHLLLRFIFASRRVICDKNEKNYHNEY